MWCIAEPTWARAAHRIAQQGEALEVPAIKAYLTHVAEAVETYGVSAAAGEQEHGLAGEGGTAQVW